MVKLMGRYFSDIISHKQFVRNDTQVSKKYYLDERGRLVAPNGTRYRLPSGPPEGRRPFQLDRSQTDKQSIKPYIHPWMRQKNFSHDYLFPEQQDTNKVPEFTSRKANTDRTSFNLNKFTHLNSSVFSKTDPLKISATQQPVPSVSGDLNPGVLHSVDWNVVLLTLILSSISLICNVTLLVFLSWKVCQVKGHHKREKPENRMTKINKQSCHNQHCESHSSQTSWTEFKQSAPPNFGPKCRCVFEASDLNGDPNFQPPLSVPGTELHTLPNSYCTNCTVKSLRQSHHSNRYPISKRKRRSKCVVDRPRLYQNQCVSSCTNKSWNENPNLSWLGRFNQFDRCSSSGGSWQMIASDGVLSESTADEADSSLESTNNSDILYEPNRMRIVRHNICHSSHKPKMVSTTISDSNLHQSAQFITCDSIVGAHSKIEKDQTNKHFPDQNQGSWSDTFEFTGGLHPVTACRQNRYVCYTLGIHLGVLGAILSVIQILAICIALNHRIRYTDQNPNQIIPATEIVCLMSNSLAADTMMCARFYLVIAFVIVTSSALYVNWVRGLLHNMNWISDMQIIRFCFFTNSLNCLDHHSIRKHIRHQQQFAFVALMHSLPWASAAGTALIIAFSFFTRQSDVDDDYLTPNKQTVNIFFGGLNSLLSCSMKTILGTQMNLAVDSDKRPLYAINHTGSVMTTRTSPITTLNITVKSTILQWMYPFLLIIIPICLQLLFLFLYFIFVYRIRHRIRTISKSLSQFIAYKPLLIIILLVSIETLSSGVPVMKSFFPSIYFNQSKSTQNIISRLIIVHLLIDPWLIGSILQVIFKIDGSNPNGTNFDEDYQQLPQTMITSTKDLDILNDQKAVNNLLAIPDVTSPENPTDHKLQRPMNILNFSPIGTQTPMIHKNQSSGNRNFQTFLMSCLPTSGIFVSTDPFPNTGHEMKPHHNIDSPGFLHPIANSIINVSSSVTPGIQHSNFQDLTLKSPLQSEPQPMQPPSTIAFSIENPKLTPPDNSVEESRIANKLVQNMYPQLCQHHQCLLEQQQNQQHTNYADSFNVSKRGREFGSVPRFNQFSVKLIQDYKPGISTAMNQIVGSDVNTQSGVITMAITSSASPIDLVTKSSNCFHRSLTGKSTATAAVMAAAAAAVAAQAGSLPRTLSHQRPPSVDNLEIFPVNSLCTPPSKPNCDIVLKNVDLSDSARKHSTNYEKL